MTQMQRQRLAKMESKKVSLLDVPKTGNKRISRTKRLKTGISI